MLSHPPNKFNICIHVCVTRLSSYVALCIWCVLSEVLVHVLHVSIMIYDYIDERVCCGFAAMFLVSI